MIGQYAVEGWQTWTDIDWAAMRGLDLHKGGRNRGQPLVKPNGDLLDPPDEPARLSKQAKELKDAALLRLAEVRARGLGAWWLSSGSRPATAK